MCQRVRRRWLVNFALVQQVSCKKCRQEHHNTSDDICETCLARGCADHEDNSSECAVAKNQCSQESENMRALDPAAKIDQVVRQAKCDRRKTSKKYKLIEDHSEKVRPDSVKSTAVLLEEHLALLVPHRN